MNKSDNNKCTRLYVKQKKKKIHPDQMWLFQTHAVLYNEIQFMNDWKEVTKKDMC